MKWYEEKKDAKQIKLHIQRLWSWRRLKFLWTAKRTLNGKHMTRIIFTILRHQRAQLLIHSDLKSILNVNWAWSITCRLDYGRILILHQWLCTCPKHNEKLLSGLQICTIRPLKYSYNIWLQFIVKVERVSNI